MKEESAVHEAFVKNDSMDEPVSKELPICDNLEENIKLASNSYSFTNVINEEHENGTYNNQHIVNKCTSVKNYGDCYKMLTLF